jgi:hypothetical protein
VQRLRKTAACFLVCYTTLASWHHIKPSAKLGVRSIVPSYSTSAVHFSSAERLTRVKTQLVSTRIVMQ